MLDETYITNNNSRLMVSGDVNFKTLIKIWNESLPFFDKHSHLHFDLVDVVSTKSAGLILILEWIRLARVKNKLISFNNIPPHLLAIAKVCGVDVILNHLSSICHPERSEGSPWINTEIIHGDPSLRSG